MKSLLLGAAAILALAAAGCTDLKRFAYDGFGRRDRWQHSERVIRELGLREGDRVADLGAGGGYFTFRLAEAVGPAGGGEAGGGGPGRDAEAGGAARGGGAGR